MAEGEGRDRGVSDLKERLEQANGEMERAEREANLQRAAELRYGEIPELEKELAELESTEPEHEQGWRSRPSRPPVFLKEEVDADDVAEIVARWTGIPVSRLIEGETEKLVHMEERLHERVVGQDEAIEAVASALRRSRAGLQDPIARSAASCSSARRVSARLSSPEHSRSSCSTARTR